MPSWRISLFFLVLILIITGFGWFVHRRTVRAFSLPPWAARSFGLVLLLGLAAAVLARAVAPHSPQLVRLLGGVGGATTLGVLISTVLILPYDIGRLLARWTRRVRGSTESFPAVPDALALPARRDFLAQAAVGSAVSIGMGSAAYGALLGRTDYTLETVPIRLAKLPRALDGFTIVQLSDLHVGSYVGEPEFRRALELVRRAKPDIVVLTGDLLDHDASYAPTLGRFARALRDGAPRGVYAVPGNHDYYAGVGDVLMCLREAGADVLVNRHVRIGDRSASFALGGFDDVAGPRFGARGPLPEQAFAGVPDELARVVLSHNPSFFPIGHTAADLTLSGHTHGGQITLFINPAEVVLRHGFVRGHYAFGASQLYVNRGFGTAGPPARVGSPPEITKLVLTTG